MYQKAYKVLLDFDQSECSTSNSTCIHQPGNRIYMDQIIDSKFNLSSTLCIASFPPSVTLLSTFLSFVLPGIIIVCSNTGKALSNTNKKFKSYLGIVIYGIRICKRDRHRCPTSPPSSRTISSAPSSAQLTPKPRMSIHGFSFKEKSPQCSKPTSPCMARKRKKYMEQLDIHYLSKRREQRLTKTCFLLSSTFIVCWLPFVTLHIYRYHCIIYCY